MTSHYIGGNFVQVAIHCTVHDSISIAIQYTLLLVSNTTVLSGKYHPASGMPLLVSAGGRGLILQYYVMSGM